MKTKVFSGRKTRWGPGKVHLSSDKKDVLGSPIALCGYASTEGARQGTRSEVTCLRCLKKMS